MLHRSVDQTDFTSCSHRDTVQVHACTVAHSGAWGPCTCPSGCAHRTARLCGRKPEDKQRLKRPLSNERLKSKEQKVTHLRDHCFHALKISRPVVGCAPTDRTRRERRERVNGPTQRRRPCAPGLFIPRALRLNFKSDEKIYL